MNHPDSPTLPVILLIRELTSPRVMQAMLVLLFGTVVCYLALDNRDIPELVGFALSAIVGYFFADRPSGDGRIQPPTDGGFPVTVSPPDAPENTATETVKLDDTHSDWSIVSDTLLVPTRDGVK